MSAHFEYDQNYDFLENEPIKTWSIARSVYWGRRFDLSCWLVSIALLACGGLLEVKMSDPNIFTLLGVGLPIAWCLFKTPYIYSYRLHAEGVIREDCIWQSEPLLKAVRICAAIGIVVMLAIAITMGSLLVFAGAGGVGLVAAVGLLNRKPAVSHWRRTYWARHDRIFVDKHQKLVVVGYRDKQRYWDGFEFVVKKKDIQPLVELLQTLMPQADVVERKWDWHRGEGSRKEPD